MATQYTFLLYAAPTQGGQVSFDDVNYQQSITSTVDSITDRTLYARPSNGYRFKWFYISSIGNRTDNPYHYGYQDTGSETAVAVFELDPTATYSVITEAKYAAGGIVTGGGTYSAGTTITLTATPNQGYHFAGWQSSTGETNPNPSFPYTVSSDVTWTAYFGTNRLIYFDRSGSGIDVPGDATVTIDFSPKLSTTLQVAPSWGSTVILTGQGVVDFPHSAIEGSSSFTVGLTAPAAATVVMVIQQKNVDSFTYQASLSSGVTTTATISASSGRIQGVN